MDDFPEKEPPRFWIAFTILCTALALCFGMLVYTSTEVHAQNVLCEPMPQMVNRLGVAKELVVWGGVAQGPEGTPIEIILFQSNRGSWSLIRVASNIGCLIGQGNSGTPIETGKGV